MARSDVSVVGLELGSERGAGFDAATAGFDAPVAGVGGGTEGSRRGLQDNDTSQGKNAIRNHGAIAARVCESVAKVKPDPRGRATRRVRAVSEAKTRTLVGRRDYWKAGRLTVGCDAL